MALGTVAWKLPELSSVHDQANFYLGQPAAEHQLAGARAWDIDVRILDAAASAIPRNATFAVLVGTKDLTYSNRYTPDAVPGYITYWLLPRRNVQDPHRADWVVSYGGDLAGIALSRRIDVAPGLTVAEVKR